MKPKPESNYVIIFFDGVRGWSVAGVATGQEIIENEPLTESRSDPRVFEVGEDRHSLAIEIDQLPKASFDEEST